MRKTKVITLSFDVAQLRFDDRLWEDFQKHYVVESVQSYFFEAAGVACLTLVVTYFDKVEGMFVAQRPTTNKPEQWRAMLDDSNIGVFELLRNWRSRCAREEGVPPYVLLTNVQLALIVKSRPVSLSDLLGVQGIGEVKVKKYGEQMLKIINGSSALGSMGVSNETSNIR